MCLEEIHEYVIKKNNERVSQGTYTENIYYLNLHRIIYPMLMKFNKFCFFFKSYWVGIVYIILL